MFYDNIDFFIHNVSIVAGSDLCFRFYNKSYIFVFQTMSLLIKYLSLGYNVLNN